MLRQGSDIHNLLQFLKDGFARFERQSVQRFHILEYIYPTFKICPTFLFLLVERRKLDKDKPQLVREDLVCVTVRKDNVRAELVGSVLQTEVHEEDAVNGLQVELPAGSLLTLTRPIAPSAFAASTVVSVITISTSAAIHSLTSA